MTEQEKQELETVLSTSKYYKQGVLDHLVKTFDETDEDYHHYIDEITELDKDELDHFICAITTYDDYRDGVGGLAYLLDVINDDGGVDLYDESQLLNEFYESYCATTDLNEMTALGEVLSNSTWKLVVAEIAESMGYLAYDSDVYISDTEHR